MPTRKYTTLNWTEYPVSEGNFDRTRKPIDLIVLHHTACTYQQAIAHFGSPTAGTSAHYIVSNKGELAAMLEEFYTAYHAGQYTVNQRSIGIESEWYDTMGDRSTALYEKISALVADICKFYNIPIDADHIKPHKTYFNTACPGSLDIARIIDRARAINAPSDPCANLKVEVSSLKTTLLNVTKERDSALQQLKKAQQTITNIKNLLA